MNPSVSSGNLILDNAISIIMCYLGFCGLILSTQIYVQPLNIIEGIVTGKASIRNYETLTIDSSTRHVFADDRFHLVEYGDWVRLACSGICFVWEIRK